jgi:hypothetical protein
MEFVPAGPANPKGNGTLESAIGQMKQIIGTVQLDTSSPGALAKSVLDAIVRVYVKMRNKLPLRRKNESPLENFTKPVEEDMIEFERQRLKQHKADKSRKSDDQAKIKRLRFLIQNKQIPCDPLAVKRAEKTITGYDMKAIIASEEAFIKAVTRKPERLNLPYFFGILRNIQKQHDDEAYQQYCRQRYNHRQMLEWQRRLQPPEKKPPTIDQILGMLERALVSPSQSVRRLCMKLARIWTGELTDGRRYLEPLRKKFMEAIAKLKHLRIEQKDQMVDYIQQFFNMKSGCDCVT